MQKLSLGSSNMCCIWKLFFIAWAVLGAPLSIGYLGEALYKSSEWMNNSQFVLIGTILLCIVLYRTLWHTHSAYFPHTTGFMIMSSSDKNLRSKCCGSFTADLFYIWIFGPLLRCSAKHRVKFLFILYISIYL